MKLRKTLLFCLAMMIVMVAAFGCSAPQQSASTPPSESQSQPQGESEKPVGSDDKKDYSDLKFGLSIHYLFDDWGKVCAEAFEAKCAEYGIQCEVANGDGKAEKQLNDVQSFYARGFDAIAINPNDITVMKEIGTTLYNEKIPFISVAPHDVFPVMGYVDGGQWDKCNASGEYMVDYLGGKGKVVLLTTTNTRTLMELREKGLMDALEGTDVEIIETKLGTLTEEFINITNDLLTSGQEFDAIYTTSGAASQGVLTALKAAGRKDIPVFGIDAEYAVMQMMKEGYGTGITAQFPSDTAETLVDYMLTMVTGGEYEDVIVEPRIREVVTPENVEEMCLEVWKKPLE